MLNYSFNKSMLCRMQNKMHDPLPGQKDLTKDDFGCVTVWAM